MKKVPPWLSNATNSAPKVRGPSNRISPNTRFVSATDPYQAQRRGRAPTLLQSGGTATFFRRTADPTERATAGPATSQSPTLAIAHLLRQSPPAGTAAESARPADRVPAQPTPAASIESAECTTAETSPL